MSAESEYVAAKIALLRQRAATGPLWLPVEGKSMGPRFPEDAEVLVVASGRSPRFAEVWLYASAAGETVAHRYVRRTAAGLVFRGDARLRSDKPVASSQLIGQVTHVRTGMAIAKVPVLGAIPFLARMVSQRLLAALRDRLRA